MAKGKVCGKGYKSVKGKCVPVDITDVVKEASKGEDLAGKGAMLGMLRRAGMSNEQIERFSKEYKSPKEEKIGKMKKQILKRRKK